MEEHGYESQPKHEKGRTSCPGWEHRKQSLHRMSVALPRLRRNPE